MHVQLYTIHIIIGNSQNHDMSSCHGYKGGLIFSGQRFGQDLIAVIDRPTVFTVSSHVAVGFNH